MNQAVQSTTTSRTPPAEFEVARWVRAHSTIWQAVWGCTLATATVTFQFAVVLAGVTNLVLIGLSLGQGVLGSIVAGWMLLPLIEELPRKSQRRLTAIPLVAYVGITAVFVLSVTLLLAPTDRVTATVLLFLVWVHHSLYGSGAEPSNWAYERLPGRLRRAAPLRVAAHVCGLVGVLLLLQHVRTGSSYSTVFVGVMATVTLGVLGASLKVFVRVRRLCAALDQHAHKLILELERLRTAPEEKRTEQKHAVEEAWGTLRRTLANKIDSGLSISGVFVLPSATITELHHLVHRAIRAAGADDRVHRQLVARLRMLRIACVGRTDTLA
ncbi:MULTISPECIES: hypothetical protein [unclassified Streptomyces]|uniref:hypothetical protein n=1 Tax=unclassified Streptomyces TaxID=2593676 RepID=UPI0008238492|nr:MULTISPECIES: hypothetical protein [unclassified Streptomyces]MYU02156.1 hypothetical protein [Streptomyces sp. SID8350]SCK61695.1 hypothetical protein YUWDRAFT_06204 [Streptomyces sp. AmelKG-D3]